MFAAKPKIKMLDLATKMLKQSHWIYRTTQQQAKRWVGPDVGHFLIGVSMPGTSAYTDGKYVC